MGQWAVQRAENTHVSIRQKESKTQILPWLNILLAFLALEHRRKEEISPPQEVCAWCALGPITYIRRTSIYDV